jgi:hypothetical protein
MIRPTLALVLSLAAMQDPTLRNDFSGKDVGKDWKLTSDAWKVEGGQLCGAGAGSLRCLRPLTGDFVLTFDGWTEEKANVEVALTDKSGEKRLLTFAFIGTFHTALGGPRSCILKGERFVAVEPRMWIFPGRTFGFEVRRAKNQFQMFLSRELGPVFTDEAPDADLDEVFVRIDVATAGPRDKLKLDNVVITQPKR